MNQNQNDTAILNYDDKILKEIGKDIKSHTQYFSIHNQVENGLYLDDKKIFKARKGKKSYYCPNDILILKGSHNLENFLAAALLAMAVGVDRDFIMKASSRFKPLEHRLEFVEEINGVEYYNDSKATNIDSTIKAIDSFYGRLILILGGKDKDGDFTVLKDSFQNKVEYVVITGDASEKIRNQIGNSIPHIIEKKFDDAVKAAMNIAKPGNIVLLAPACASFDQFKNYEERGRRFKEVVKTGFISQK